MTVESGPSRSIEDIFQIVKNRQRSVFSEENIRIMDVFKPGTIDHFQGILASAEILTATITILDDYFSQQPKEDHYISDEQIVNVSQRIIQHPVEPINMAKELNEFARLYIPDINEKLAEYFGINPENPPTSQHL